MHNDYDSTNMGDGNRNLVPLAELDSWELENSDQDLRGRPLMSEDGQSVGTITEMLVDRERERVAAVTLTDGRMVPIEQVQIRGGSAYLAGAGVVGTAATSRASGMDRGNEMHIPIVEERMVVGKRQVDTGGVRVSTHMEERPVEENVTLRQEHVEIERRPVADGRIDSADAARLMADKEIEVTATSEEAVIGKEARVTEEVVIRKDVDTRTETVRGTERETKVDVDRLSDANRTDRDRI